MTVGENVDAGFTARRLIMEYIEVEYNRELKPLEATLSDVKRPGDFFIAGTMEIPMPRVELKRCLRLTRLRRHGSAPQFHN